MAKGKSKNKARKPQTSTEKFVVVVDPWRSRNFFEDIGTWFEIMLQDDYPGTRVDMIYGQVGKHQNVIVQLPGHIDIRPILGAHPHATILKPPYNMNTEGVSYIFEYNFESEGHPRDWATFSPSYESIDPNFPIRSPYPIPCTVPRSRRNTKPGYAKQLPKDLWEESGITTILPTNQTNDISGPNASIPSSNAISSTTPSSKQLLEAVKTEDKTALRSIPQFSPYNSPSHHPSHTEYPKPARTESQDPRNKKKDPYEQIDDAERLLHADSPSRSGASAKREDDPADAFLRSILPVKQEEISPAKGYEPSPDLLATFGTLPKHLLNASSTDSAATLSVTVKNKPVITKQPAKGYEPSPELLATFGTLPKHFLNASSTDSAATLSITVKNEPVITERYRPSDELLAAFGTLPSQLLNPGGSAQNATPIKHEEAVLPWVKAESREDTSLRARSVTLGADARNSGQPNMMTQVKDEFQADSNAFSSNAAVRPSDPRKRPQAPTSSLPGVVKKMKMEY